MFLFGSVISIICLSFHNHKAVAQVFLDNDTVLADARELIDRFSYVMDLSLRQDLDIYETVPEEFVNEILPKCEQSVPCVGSIINLVLRGIYNMYSYISKDQLASGQAQNVSVPFLERTVTWAHTLLDFVLRRPFISMNPRCHEMNPIHLAALYRMHDTLQKLLTVSVEWTDEGTEQDEHHAEGRWNKYAPPAEINCKASDFFGFTPLHIAILNRDMHIAELLVSHCANVFTRDYFNRSSVDLVMNILQSSGDTRWVKLIQANKNDCTSHSDIDSDVDANQLQSHSPVSIEQMCDNSVQENVAQSTVIDKQSDAHGDLNPPSQNLCPMDTLHVTNLTLAFFVEHYVSQRKPLLIRGATSDWRIRETWQRQSMAQSPFGDLEVLIGSIPYANVFGKLSTKVPLREYVHYLDNISISSDKGVIASPYYIFDPNILVKTDSANAMSFYDSAENAHPQWLMDALLEKEIFGSIPPFSEPGSISLLKTEVKPTPITSITKQFYMGPPLSVTKLLISILTFHLCFCNATMCIHSLKIIFAPCPTLYQILQC